MQQGLNRTPAVPKPEAVSTRNAHCCVVRTAPRRARSCAGVRGGELCRGVLTVISRCLYRGLNESTVPDSPPLLW